MFNPPKYYRLIFMAGLFYGICFILSCVFPLKKQAEQPPEPVKQKQTKKQYRKETLEFAFAGDARRTAKPQRERPDTIVVESEPVPRPPTAKTNKMSRKDSLYQAMIQKTRRLSSAADKNQTSFYDITKQPNEPVKQETEKIDMPIKSASRRPKHSDPDNPPLTIYQDLIKSMKEGDEPVAVQIKKGRDYWIGSIAGKIFTPGSNGFYKTLDWIIENNNRFKNKADLDFVKSGDQVIFPAKQMINNILLAQR